MATNVFLTIRGVQKAFGQEDVNEISVAGSYYQKDGKHYLFYKEYQEDGPILQNRLIIDENYAQLKKSGNGESVLNFRVGHCESCTYQSAVGPMNLVSDTRRIKIIDRDNQMKFMLFYSLYMGGSHMSDYELVISFRKNS